MQDHSGLPQPTSGVAEPPQVQAITFDSPLAMLASLPATNPFDVIGNNAYFNNVMVTGTITGGGGGGGGLSNPLTETLLFSPDGTHDIGEHEQRRPRNLYLGTSVIFDQIDPAPTYPFYGSLQLFAKPDGKLYTQDYNGLVSPVGGLSNPLTADLQFATNDAYDVGTAGSRVRNLWVASGISNDGYIINASYLNTGAIIGNGNITFGAPWAYDIGLPDFNTAEGQPKRIFANLGNFSSVLVVGEPSPYPSSGVGMLLTTSYSSGDSSILCRDWDTSTYKQLNITCSYMTTDTESGIFFNLSGVSRWSFLAGEGHMRAYPDNTNDIGEFNFNRPRNIHIGGFVAGPQIKLSPLDVPDPTQLLGGNGTPNGADANAAGLGAFWFRNATPGTVNQRIYVKTSAGDPGAWTGIL